MRHYRLHIPLQTECRRLFLEAEVILARNKGHVVRLRKSCSSFDPNVTLYLTFLMPTMKSSAK